MMNISLNQLKRAIIVREKIDRLQNQFAELLQHSSARSVSGIRSGKGRRRMPPSAKAKLSAIAKLRWKKAKAAGKHRL